MRGVALPLSSFPLSDALSSFACGQMRSWIQELSPGARPQARDSGQLNPEAPPLVVAGSGCGYLGQSFISRSRSLWV